MIYSCLAALSVVATYGQLADNVALNNAERCNNYIRVGYDKLYPVGTCWQENTDETELITTSGPTTTSFLQNMQWTCRAAGNGTEACENRMNLGCTAAVYVDESTCRPCNGADDQCECEVGGDASECTFYEETTYDKTFSFSGWYCNKKVHTLERTVVNMCIQGDTNTPSWYTYAYVCGGYDWRSGNTQPYADNQVWHSTADCSDDRYAGYPTSAPTEATLAPTVNPTEEGESPFSSVWCSESTCAGVNSPRADDASVPQATAPPTRGFDMIYLLDSSAGVSVDNFMSQIAFAETFVNCALTDDGHEDILRVSLISYGGKVKKLFGLTDVNDGISFDFDMISDEDMVGGNRHTDEALAAALEEFETNGRYGSIKWVKLISNGAPMTNHELCLGDYVSPQLEKMRDLGDWNPFQNIGINLDAATMENLQCLVPAGEEEYADDFVINTESLEALAEEWEYTECGYDEEEEYE